jgi:hypothetical protein
MVRAALARITTQRELMLLLWMILKMYKQLLRYKVEAL